MRDRAHARARPQLGSRPPARVGQRLIEHDAIDDGRADARGVDEDRAAVGGDESRGVRGGEDGVPGKVDLVERVDAEEARAVNGDADLVVLLQDHDVVSAGGKGARRHEPGRSGADNDYVMQVGSSILPASGFPSAQQANPK